MRVLLFINPRSRRGRALGSAVRVQLTRNGIESVEGAAGEHIDAIVVAGGDGTVARHISRALELDVPIGIVPLGTFNDLARTLAIPFDLAAACALIGLRIFEPSTPPLTVHSIPVPAQAMHFKKPRRSTPSFSVSWSM